jgi:hypothetical protein
MDRNDIETVMKRANCIKMKASKAQEKWYRNNQSSLLKRRTKTHKDTDNFLVTVGDDRLNTQI